MVTQFTPVRRSTLSGEVANRSGARLPAERELGVQFGVGRTSIREALRLLQAIGLVTVRPGDGVFVANFPSPNDQPYACWEFQYQYRVEELFEGRLAIEPLAAARAATRAEQDDIQALSATLLDLETGIEEGDLAGMVLANRGFHNAVARASQNRIIQAMLRSVHHLLIERSTDQSQRPSHSRAAGTTRGEGLGTRGDHPQGSSGR